MKPLQEHVASVKNECARTVNKLEETVAAAKTESEVSKREITAPLKKEKAQEKKLKMEKEKEDAAKTEQVSTSFFRGMMAGIIASIATASLLFRQQ